MSRFIIGRRRGATLVALALLGVVPTVAYRPPARVLTRASRPVLRPLRHTTASAHVLRSHAAPLRARLSRRRRVPDVCASAAMATASVRRAIMPVLWVVSTCIVALVPTTLALLQQQVSKGRRGKLLERTFTGCALGLVVSMWIFSSTFVYVLVFCVMGVLAQQEYYKMAANRGYFPARKLSILGSLAMYVAGADGRRGVIDAALPLAGIYTTMYLLTRPKPEPTLDDVTTTFMGIYYLGFVPSFWVRLRGLSTGAAPFVFSWWPAALRPERFTHGAVITWWTFLSIVCSDIGAYFVGKTFGSRKLCSAVSPNKTVEGAVGGALAAMGVSMLGGYLMGWPLWWISGAINGLLASVMALVGDLTISMFKRSSGVKVRPRASRAAPVNPVTRRVLCSPGTRPHPDRPRARQDTGNLLPGHGGLLDRIDSFLLAAAPVYFYVKYALPLFPQAPLSLLS